LCIALCKIRSSRSELSPGGMILIAYLKGNEVNGSCTAPSEVHGLAVPCDGLPTDVAVGGTNAHIWRGRTWPSGRRGADPCRLTAGTSDSFRHRLGSATRRLDKNAFLAARKTDHLSFLSAGPISPRPPPSF
jgi:hypothetical protein